VTVVVAIAVDELLRERQVDFARRESDRSKFKRGNIESVPLSSFSEPAAAADAGIGQPQPLQSPT
jgi:hypothetical protein